MIKSKGKPKVDDSEVPKSSSSVPHTESASSGEASEFLQYWRSVRNSLSNAHKASYIPKTTSNPSSKKVSQETLNRILFNNSISLFKIGNGSQVVARQTQSTVTTEVPTQETSDQDSRTDTLSQVDSQSPPRSSPPPSLGWGLYD